jgi:hypothetical protein
MKLDLHIEELVLYDLPHHHRHAVVASIERELTRLFTENGVPPAWDGHTHIQVGDISITATGRPEAIGAQIAQTIYSGLTSSQGE